MSSDHRRKQQSGKQPMTEDNLVKPQLSPELSAFEAIRHRDHDGQEYWLARELMKLLGYRRWQNFQRVIEEAIAVCSQEGSDSATINFTAISKNKVAEGLDPRGRGGEDYQLTRHACYIIAESADGRKEEVAWAKIYFAYTTERYELLAETEEDAIRIEQRQKIVLYNTELKFRAHLAGAITAKQYADFFNAGYRSMYDGETAEDIRIRKGLPPKADILDWMGSVESAANGMRAALTLHHMKQRNVSTLQEANKTHSQVGTDVRAFLISQNIYPRTSRDAKEKLPTTAT